MKGLGDSIFIRAFVKMLHGEVYLSTPWPEIYEDLPNVRFVNPRTQLRTQAKNVLKTEHTFGSVPSGCRKIHVQYTGQDFKRGSLIDGLQRCFRVSPGEFDLPRFDSPVKTDKPIAVIRPVTVRKEWANPARNPDPEYINRIADKLKDSHYVVSIADLEDGHEWIIGDPPHADLVLHHGELDIRGLLGLVSHADLCVGGVGWILPACIAYQVPLFCILGGQGGHNAPERVTSPDMDLSRIWFAKPDKFCLCANMSHNCDKTITRLDEQWRLFLTP